MKTSIKIILLIFFSIIAAAGVLVFAKTRVAPPSNLQFRDQYAMALLSDCKDFNDISDFQQSRLAYIEIDDKVKRFNAEDAIDTETADRYRVSIDSIYGKHISEYGYDLLKKSEWHESQLSEMLGCVDALKSDKLSTGKSAVSDEISSELARLHSIVNDYHAALNLSRSTTYSGVSDASNKISRAKKYMNEEYLKNNAQLVSALSALPGKIASSHYGYVSGLVNSLGGYMSVTEDYYNNTLIPRVDKAINEYKSTKIYGGNKQSVSSLENRAVSLIENAMNYYSED